MAAAESLSSASGATYRLYNSRSALYPPVEALAMLLASRSSDSIRARSPLAAMAVMGSIREGKSTARANRGLGYNCLKQRRISPKRRIGTTAVRGKSLPKMAWRAFFCRTMGHQLLENAHARFGLRAAIPAAWLLSRYLLRFSLHLSGCQRRATRPGS